MNNNQTQFETTIIDILNRHLTSVVSDKVKSNIASDIKRLLGFGEQSVTISSRFEPRPLSEGNEKNIKPVPTRPRPAPPKPQKSRQ